MDDDTELTDDDSIYDVNDSLFEEICPPNPSLNGTTGADNFSECFYANYEASPAFFSGSLRDACEAASSSTIINERRPLLIYIHHETRFFTNIFCSQMFCSTVIVDYLLESYIVWPCDITDESGENRLNDIWQEMFSTPFSDSFTKKDCPLLIGVKRLYQKEKNGLIINEYQFKSLLKNDTLTRNQKKITRELLLNELFIFKEEYHENEQALATDFITKTGLCWDVILQITEYLSLNDAINAFSRNILPILSKCNRKVHINEPSPAFMRMVLSKLKSEQIVSLQFNAGQQCISGELASPTIFSNVTSISLWNFLFTNRMERYKDYMGNLIRLSLWYDSDIAYQMITDLISRVPESKIKRLEIRSPGMLCTHYGLTCFNNGQKANNTVEYLLIDMSYFPIFSMSNCLARDLLCLSETTIDFIEHMSNVQRVCLRTNQYNVDILLNINEWCRLLVSPCYLKKVTIHVIGSMPEDIRIMQKILKIQTRLSPKLEFRVIFE